MPFIGNQPAEAYSSFQKQDFTTSATTSYTLDHPVANANEIALFINFVRQEPTAAYTASGTSLTLTSATSSSDDMYCIYLGKAVQTVNPPNSSVGTSQLDSSLDFSSKTITLADNMKNTPAFEAYISSDQTISDDSTAKLQFDTEVFDSDGTYDNSTNYRFTPAVAGKYYIYGAAKTLCSSASQLRETYLYIYKNGSSYKNSIFRFANNDAQRATPTISAIMDLNTTDYIELYLYVNNASSGTLSASGSDKGSYFGAYKIIGA